MNANMFPALVGNKVTVKIPEGLPALMMLVTREVLRDPPDTEMEAYLYVADYLQCMLAGEHGEDNLLISAKKIDKSNVEMYLEKLERAGYTLRELNDLALIIQKGWKRYKALPRRPKDITCMEQKQLVKVWTPEMVTDDLTKMLVGYGVSLGSANAAAIIIQRAWRTYHKSMLEYTSDVRRSSTQFETESFDELGYEYDSDDMERVNVVKKSQKGYVPPIPDFIGDSDLFKSQSSLTNNLDKLLFEDEGGYEDSIN